MQESVTTKGQGGVSPTTPRADSGSTIDEDWSIISSSSDFDDERSTTSSDGKQNIGLDDQFESLDIDGSIFKVPKLISGLKKQDPMESIQGSARSNSAGKIAGWVDSEKVENNHSPLSFSLESYLDDSVSDELSKSVNVGSKIKFFENMSMFNESIKQKSSDFYSNYAKDKIDQLNRYVSEQNRSVGLGSESVESKEPLQATRADGTGAIAAASAEVDTDLEDTIELQARENIEPQEMPIDKPPSNAETLKDANRKRSTDSTKVRIVNAVQQFLNTHSEYLYYYLFAILVGLIPTVYAIHHLIATKETKPITTFEKLNYCWDNFVYQEASVTNSNFFPFGHKKLKVNRFVNYGKQMRANLKPRVVFLREWANKAVTGALPIANSWLSKARNTLMLANKNSKHWFEEASRFTKNGFGTLKELASQGSDITSKYGKYGVDYASHNGKIFAKNLSSYTRTSVDTLDACLRTSSAGVAVGFDKSVKFSTKHGNTASRLLRRLRRKWIRAGRNGLRRSNKVSRKAIKNVAKLCPKWRKSVGLQLSTYAKWGALFWSKDSLVGKQIQFLSKLVFKKFSEYAKSYRGVCDEKGLEVL